MHCYWCGKEIISTTDRVFPQSSYRHADGTGAGTGNGHLDEWCETPEGYEKVGPAPLKK